MSKKILLIFIGLFTIILTGCGSKEEILTCYLEEDNGIITYKAKIEEDELVELTYIEEKNFDSKELAQKNYEMIEQLFFIFESYEGVTLENKIKGTKSIYSMSVDIKKVKESKQEGLEMEFETLEEFNEFIKTNNYICK